MDKKKQKAIFGLIMGIIGAFLFFFGYNVAQSIFLKVISFTLGILNVIVIGKKLQELDLIG